MHKDRDGDGIGDEHGGGRPGGGGGGDTTAVNMVSFSETPNQGGEGDDVIFGDIAFTSLDGNLEALGFTEDDDGNYTVDGNNYFFSLGDVDLESLETLEYGAGNDDSLWGYGGNDFLFAGSGNDLIYASIGDDYINGGSHDGTNKVNQIGDSVNYNGSSTGDTLEVNLGANLDGDPNTNDGIATFTSGGESYTQTLVDIESIRGSKGDDTLIGDVNNNTLNGQPGDDIINGGGGDDELIGGKGIDTLNGGDGNDWLTGGWDPEGSGMGKRVVDTFVFDLEFGDDTITDYTHDIDILSFASELEFTGLLTDSDVDNDGILDTVLTFADGSSLTLLGVSGFSDTDFFSGEAG